MKTVFLMTSVYLCMAVHCLLRDSADRRAILRRLSVLSATVDIRENRRGGWWFPDTIEFTLNIDELGVRQIRADRLKLRSLRTKVIKMGPESQLREKYRISQDIEFYTNSDGSFACKPTSLNGQLRCELFGIVHGDKESCLFHGERAFCRKTIDKTGLVYDYIEITRDEQREEGQNLTLSNPYPWNRTSSDGSRESSIPTPSASAQVIQLAIFLDQSFMSDFYEFSPGNDEEAETLAEMYTLMAANEITYRYQQLKKLRIPYRGGILDLAVNPTSIIYPEKGKDFVFVQKIGTAMFSTVLGNFGRYVETMPPEPFKHAMLFTRLNMYFGESGIIGQTFPETVCSEDPVKSVQRVSISEDLDFNVADTATHELGHALGALHDDGGFFSPCATDRYIMSETAVVPNYFTKNTAFRFSICNIHSELFGEVLVYGYLYDVSKLTDLSLSLNERRNTGMWPDCLSRASDETFLENFCAGPRGIVQNSLDYQCKTYHGFGPDASACNGNVSYSYSNGCYKVTPPGTKCKHLLLDAEKTALSDRTKVPAYGCWRPYTLSCNPDPGVSCTTVPYVAEGTPCDGKGGRYGESYMQYGETDRPTTSATRARVGVHKKKETAVWLFGFKPYPKSRKHGDAQPKSGKDVQCSKGKYCYLGDCVKKSELCPEDTTPTCFCDRLNTVVTRNVCCRFARCC